MGNQSNSKVSSLKKMQKTETIEDWETLKFKFWFLQDKPYSARELVPKPAFLRRNKIFFGECSKILLNKIDNKINFPLSKEEILSILEKEVSQFLKHIEQRLLKIR
jgi:hypothetical protein